MATKDEYLAAVELMTPGVHPLGQAEETKAIRKALDLHSTFRPQRLVQDVQGTGAFDYALSTLACWSDDFSTIGQVEHPVDDAQEVPNVLEDEDWSIYEKPAGKYLRFIAARPAVTEFFRVTYTAPHEFDVNEKSTVSLPDEAAVQTLAASFYCRMLSAAYAQSQDSTIQADSVDHKSLQANYESLAQKYRAEYDEHMNVKGGPRPASYNQDQDVVYPFGIDRITHPRKWR